MAGFISRVVPEENIIIVLGIFFMYSIIGWMVESTYMSFCNKKITNRGFIRGPICPIYGVGEFVVYTILAPIANNYIFIFIAGSMLATAVEFITAKIMIRKLGYVWWDYTNKPFNYNGIVCLESSLAWGMYAIFEFAFLREAIKRTLMMIPYPILSIMVIILIFYYLISLVKSIRRISNGEIESEENNLLQA